MKSKNTEIRPFAGNRIAYVGKLIEAKKNDRVLNVGISNIPEIEMAIENAVKECWTIDIDRDKLKKASKYLKKTKLVYEDINRKTRFKKNYFDKIIMLEVLEHIKDDESAVRKINSLLKKGGHFILSVPNDDMLHVINPVKYTQHERHYSNQRIIKLLEREGFEIEHFNIVENWTLLANLYIHIVFKYLLGRNIKFDILKNRTYMQNNKNGLDIILRARKK